VADCDANSHVPLCSKFDVLEALSFRVQGRVSNLQVADTDSPLQGVSVIGKGRFKGKALTSLYTTRIRPTGKSRDTEEGAGILYLEGKSRASYRIGGSIGSTHKMERVGQRGR
jgi:hypothetical protein